MLTALPIRRCTLVCTSYHATAGHHLERFSGIHFHSTFRNKSSHCSSTYQSSLYVPLTGTGCCSPFPVLQNSAGANGFSSVTGPVPRHYPDCILHDEISLSLSGQKTGSLFCVRCPRPNQLVSFRLFLQQFPRRLSRYGLLVTQASILLSLVLYLGFRHKEQLSPEQVFLRCSLSPVKQTTSSIP